MLTIFVLDFFLIYNFSKFLCFFVIVLCFDYLQLIIYKPFA